MNKTYFSIVKVGDQFFYKGNSYVRIDERAYTATIFSGAEIDVVWNVVNLLTRKPYRFDDSKEVTILKRIEDYYDKKSNIYDYPEEPREIDVKATPEVEEAFDQFFCKYSKDTSRYFHSERGSFPMELLTMAILRRLE